jgi:hypothetical protein
MRMGDLGTHTPGTITSSTVGPAVLRFASNSITQLRKDLFDGAVIARIRVRAQQTRQMVYVPAGEADEGFFLCAR